MESRPGQRGTGEAVGVKGAADAKRMVPNSAASLLTTVADYAMFVTHIAWPQGSSDEIKKTTYAKMTKPQVRIHNELAWGWGGGFKRMRGRSICGQWGDNGEWKNIVMVHPQSASAIVVLTNSDTGMHICERVVTAAAGKEQPAFLWI
jgi:hypothetical protein